MRVSRRPERLRLVTSMSFSTSCCARNSRVHSAVFVGRAGVDTQRDVFRNILQYAVRLPLRRR